MPDNLIGANTELPFPTAREVGIDTVRIGMTRHHIPVLAEVDVTLARAAIAKRKEAAGEGLSFTGWVIKCLAQAASEHKRVHALRLGRHRLVLFDDVDVSIVVQRRLVGSEPPEFLPMPYVIRKANEKTVEAIQAEIRAAQARALAPREQTIDLAEKMPSPRAIRIFASMPFFIWKAVYWNRLFRDPFRVKRTMGTVSVTSVGVFGKVSGGSSWGNPRGVPSSDRGTGGDRAQARGGRGPRGGPRLPRHDDRLRPRRGRRRARGHVPAAAAGVDGERVRAVSPWIPRFRPWRLGVA